MKLVTAVVCAMASNPVITRSAQQATFTDRPIRLVIGSAAGSGPDIISRVMGERLAKAWGQRIVAQALADTMAREVHVTYSIVPAALAMIQPGRVRTLGVTSRKRSAMLQ